MIRDFIENLIPPVYAMAGFHRMISTPLTLHRPWIATSTATHTWHWWACCYYPHPAPQCSTTSLLNAVSHIFQHQQQCMHDPCGHVATVPTQWTWCYYTHPAAQCFTMSLLNAVRPIFLHQQRCVRGPDGHVTTILAWWSCCCHHNKPTTPIQL